MKLLPLQKDLLTHMLRGGRTVIQEEENNVLIGDGYVLWVIPKDKYFLAKKGEKFDLAHITERDYSREISDRGERLVVGRETVMIMRDDEGTETKINAKFVKHFENPKFFQEGQNDPIKVQENGKTVGYIMPIRTSQ